MSFKKNKNQQLNIFDSYLNQSDRVKKMIKKSWCHYFSEIVFPAINEERFSVLYSGNQASRPNTPVNFIIGALILKEINGLSDEELIASICCDVRYQYALHTTQCQEQPVSDRTFSRFRERLYNYTLETGRDLLAEEMENLTEEFSKYMKLNSNIKRMDSLQVASRCRKMTRLELVYSTTSKAIKLIQRMNREELISEELKHYLEEDDYNKVTYYCPADEVENQFQKIIREAEKLRQIMDKDEFRETIEYQLLFRVLLEQTNKDEHGNVTPKENREISANSLQNPSDPDATFRRKAGKKYHGYVCNIVETVDEGRSLITGVNFEKNTYSDTKFCHDYLESRENTETTEILVTDGAYESPENLKLAKEKNVDLVTTNLNGQTVDVHFADFEIKSENEVKCPHGYTPIKTSYYENNERWRLVFSKEICINCPHQAVCAKEEQKNSYAVNLSKKMIQRAAYLKKISTEEFKNLCKMRNAVEGIPSVLRRKYHIDEIPTFGLIRTKMFVIFKAIAYNCNKFKQYLCNPRENCLLTTKI